VPLRASCLAEQPRITPNYLVEPFISPAVLTAALSQVAMALVWFAVGLIFYAWLFDRAVFEGKGRVPAERFGPLDFGIATVLITFFAFVTVAGFRSMAGEKPGASSATPSETGMVIGVIVNTMIFGTIIGGILGSLSWRGIRWRESFGLDRVTPPAAAAKAALLLLLALPVISGALLMTQLALGSGGNDRQEVVQFFAESGSSPAKWVVALSAVVLAPLMEEIIFRGYLYPVLRRYLGVTLGVLLNAALFAAIHLHGPSLGGLFMLAVCVTLAYEWTGSILVPVLMHALFNSLTVVNLLFLSGRG
jgi:membrane protease YdiL (CAAX protease family)